MLSPLTRQLLLSEHRRALTMEQVFRAGAYAGFDFSDLDVTKRWGPDQVRLLVQDSIGSPVTATGQSVAVVFDKSAALIAGPELLSNTDFSSATGWIKDTGWTIGGGKATHAPSASNEDILRNEGVAVGDMMRAEVTVSGRTAGQLFVANPFVDSGVGLSANGKYVAMGVAVAAGQTRFRATPAFDGSIDDASARKVAGFVAVQSSSSARPTFNDVAGVKHLGFDGNDDALATVLVPVAEMTLAACFRASGASQNVIGSTAAANANRCYLATDSAGLIGAGWGTDTPSVIHGGASIAGADVVALLRANATVVELWLNDVLVYSAPPNGSPLNGFGLTLGARNVAGTASSFLNGRIYRAAAVQRFIPTPFVRPLMRLLGAGVVF